MGKYLALAVACHDVAILDMRGWMINGNQDSGLAILSQE
jgi:hypothetical protein